MQRSAFLKMQKSKRGRHFLSAETEDSSFGFDDAIRSLQDADDKIGEFIKKKGKVEAEQGGALRVDDEEI